MLSTEIVVSTDTLKNGKRKNQNGNALKTKNAFAFADFDKNRILSREFFCSLNLSVGTDEEILKSTNISTVDTTENTVVLLAEIRQKLKAYKLQIERHIKRLENYSNKIAVKLVEIGENRSLRSNYLQAKELKEKYLSVKNAIKNLSDVVQDMIKNANDALSIEYRKIFALKLQKARQTAGLTQKGLAQKLGIPIYNLISYENAKREPDISLIQRIIKTLDITANTLFENCF